jgi:hypothetical protein
MFENHSGDPGASLSARGMLPVAVVQIADQAALETALCFGLRGRFAKTLFDLPARGHFNGTAEGHDLTADGLHPPDAVSRGRS